MRESQLPKLPASEPSQPVCAAEILLHEDMIRRAISFIHEALIFAGVLSCCEFTEEKLRHKGQESIAHIAAIHIRAFGSESYKPKTLGELRSLVKAALLYSAGLIEKAEKKGNRNL
jgi:hypothetical protein